MCPWRNSSISNVQPAPPTTCLTFSSLEDKININNIKALHLTQFWTNPHCNNLQNTSSISILILQVCFSVFQVDIFQEISTPKFCIYTLYHQSDQIAAIFNSLTEIYDSRPRLLVMQQVSNQAEECNTLAKYSLEHQTMIHAITTRTVTVQLGTVEHNSQLEHTT
jgi:hypothetical protein